MKTAGIYLDYDSFYIKLKKHTKQYPALGMDACVQWKCIKAGFLNLCMTDIWGWIILRDEGTVLHNAGICQYPSTHKEPTAPLTSFVAAKTL